MDGANPPAGRCQYTCTAHLSEYACVAHLHRLFQHDDSVSRLSEMQIVRKSPNILLILSLTRLASQWEERPTIKPQLHKVELGLQRGAAGN